MNFSKFCEEKKEKKDEKTEDILRQSYDDLKDLSHDELTERLYREVKKQKENGEFDINALQENVERLKMFIPQDTYMNMKNMIEKLK